ncbi:MAG: hypothetical protein PVF69_13805 [Gemmatimonadota bacterium]|jgi:hypothetical protein
MSRHIPWVRILTEGVVIVTSILLALAADAWWDSRQSLSEERELLVALRAETLLNEEKLDSTTRTVEAGKATLVTFTAWDPAEPGSVPDDSLRNLFVVAMVRSFTEEIDLGTLEATISSGKLDLVRDQGLRALLVTSATLDDQLSELRQIATTLSVEASVAISHYREAALIVGSGQSFDFTYARMPPAVSRATFAELRTDPSVSSIAAAKIAYWTGYTKEMGDLHSHLEKVVEAIDLYLGP